MFHLLTIVQQRRKNLGVLMNTNRTIRAVRRNNQPQPVAFLVVRKLLLLVFRLQVLLAREPSRPAPLIRTWWPSAMAVPPQIRLTNRIPARDIFMLRPIANVGIPERVEEVFYWRGDYF